MKNKKEASKTKKPTAHYDLCNIRQLIDEDKIRIRPDALGSAFDDFGWEVDNIKDALKKLQPKHYYKPDDHHNKPGIIVDYYKARGIKNEDIYTHFYIDDVGYLVISSFKKI